jgi:hypothetical protein
MGTSAILPALLVAGSVLNAVGTIRQGQAAKDAGKVARQEAERNAAIARERGATAAVERKTKIRQDISLARADSAGRGLDLENAGDALSDIAIAGSTEAAAIRRNAELQALGFEERGATAEIQGKIARDESRLAATGSILTGAALSGVFQPKKKQEEEEETKFSRGFSVGKGVFR